MAGQPESLAAAGAETLLGAAELYATAANVLASGQVEYPEEGATRVASWTDDSGVVTKLRQIDDSQYAERQSQLISIVLAAPHPVGAEPQTAGFYLGEGGVFYRSIASEDSTTFGSDDLQTIATIQALLDRHPASPEHKRQLQGLLTLLDEKERPSPDGYGQVVPATNMTINHAGLNYALTIYGSPRNPHRRAFVAVPRRDSPYQDDFYSMSLDPADQRGLYASSNREGARPVVEVADGLSRALRQWFDGGIEPEEPAARAELALTDDEVHDIYLQALAAGGEGELGARQSLFVMMELLARTEGVASEEGLHYPPIIEAGGKTFYSLLESNGSSNQAQTTAEIGGKTYDYLLLEDGQNQYSGVNPDHPEPRTIARDFAMALNQRLLQHGDLSERIIQQCLQGPLWQRLDMAITLLNAQPGVPGRAIRPEPFWLDLNPYGRQDIREVELVAVDVGDHFTIRLSQVGDNGSRKILHSLPIGKPTSELKRAGRRTKHDAEAIDHIELALATVLQQWQYSRNQV